MIHEQDVIKALEKGVSNKCVLDAEKRNIIEKDTGKLVIPISIYVLNLRKQYHCNFDVLCALPNLTVYQCRDCGTVVFDTINDETLTCPYCKLLENSSNNQKLQLKDIEIEYWTPDEIKKDKEKQHKIDEYKEIKMEQLRKEKRIRDRGLLDSEIWKTKIDFKKSSVEVSIECLDLFKTGLKGLHLNVSRMKLNQKKCWKIPLAPQLKEG